MTSYHRLTIVTLPVTMFILLHVTVALDELCTSWQQCGNVTEVCYKQDACEYGICDCGPGYERYTQGIIDYCTLTQPILGQACSAQTPACKAGSCVNGVCTCDADQMASVSGLFCELTVQFGSNCTQSEECYGYSDGLVVCLNGTCTCPPELTNNANYTCTYYNIGEACEEGVSTCVSNSECINSTCTCGTDMGSNVTLVWKPITFLSNSVVGQCVNPSATQMNYGDPCDSENSVNVQSESASYRYCAQNLICSVCPNELTTTRCLNDEHAAYLPVGGPTIVVKSASSHNVHLSAVLLTAAVLSVLCATAR